MYHTLGVAKLTVYIPDDLLDQARTLSPGANTSQLVQRGLERLLPAEDAVYARRPDNVEDLLASAADQLRKGAAHEFERGYRAALSTVSKAGERLWRGLDSLAGKGFDLVQWTRSWREILGREAAGLVAGEPTGFNPPEWFGPLADDLGDLLDPIDFPRWSFTPTSLFVRGYQAALRDVWEEAERPPADGMSEDTPAAEASEDGAEPDT